MGDQYFTSTVPSFLRPDGRPVSSIDAMVIADAEHNFPRGGDGAPGVVVVISRAY